MSNIYEFTVKDRQGNEVSLKEYEGKTLLIVNTATGCGFTPQYEGLENLYQKYKDRGLVILDFPCNQFGNQAPGTDDEIHTFCTTRYNVTFPQFSKVEVNGENEIPLYTFLKKEQKGILGNKIKWNFTKFLVDKTGKVVERFAPTVKPEEIDEKINKIL